MPEMVKVKFPKVAEGWAWLSPSDFKKPKPDGTAWELWEEDSAAAGTPSEESLNTGHLHEQHEEPAPDGEPAHFSGAGRKTRRKF